MNVKKIKLSQNFIASNFAKYGIISAVDDQVLLNSTQMGICIPSQTEINRNSFQGLHRCSIFADNLERVFAH